jgi:hypothetical protein
MSAGFLSGAKLYSNIVFENVDLEDFDEQINELLTSIRNVLDKDIPRLKGQERVEVLNPLKMNIAKWRSFFLSRNATIYEID